MTLLVDLGNTRLKCAFADGDTVREVLGSLGTVRFDNVAAWPGHILGVGTVGGEDGGTATPIFCLPGDPVSAQVCFEVSSARPCATCRGGSR